MGDFLRFVEYAQGATVLGVSYRLAGRELNLTLRRLVGGGDADLTLHLLRHSMTSLLQADGVPVAYTQAILGQSSGTLAYDTYGLTLPVVLTERLPKRSLMVTNATESTNNISSGREVLVIYAMIRPGVYGYEVRTDDDEWRLLMVCDTENTARDYCVRNALKIVG